MPKKNTALKVVAYLVRGLTAVIVFSVIGFLLWRISASGTPRELRDLTVNENVAEAYSENGSLTLFYQEQSTITRGKNDAGYFSALSPTFIEEADEFQVVFRYNNSTIRATAEDYELDAVPNRADELYDVSLVIVTDLTPENKDDNLLRENDPEKVLLTRIKPDESQTIKLEKNLYNYRKLVFDGVSVDENVIAIYLDVFYVGDIRYNNEDFDVYAEEPYSALCVYDFKTATEYRKLSNADKKALESFSAE